MLKCRMMSVYLVEEIRALLCQFSANFQNRMKLSEYHDITLRTHFLPGGKKYMHRKWLNFCQICLKQPKFNISRTSGDTDFSYSSFQP